MERERETDEYLLPPAAVYPRLAGLSERQAAAIRRRIAYEGARRDLERRQLATWERILGCPLRDAWTQRRPR